MTREIGEGIDLQGIVKIARLRSSRPDIMPLWFGESDTVTPDFIRNAAKNAIDAGNTFYVDRRGIPVLRQEIVNYLKRVSGVSLDIDRISAVASGMTAIMIAAQCLLNAGDNIVVVSPIWPNVGYAIATMGAKCRYVRLTQTGERWTLDLNELKSAIDGRTRGVFIASPGNPTGWIMPQEQQVETLKICRDKKIWVVADEVYHRITFNGKPAPSFLQVAEPDDALLVVQSFSKTWAMTGWRLGWLVHPTSVSDRIGDLSAVNNTGATSFVQHAGVAALRQGEDFIKSSVGQLHSNLDFVYERLSHMKRVRLGPRPEGAFYTFFSVDGVADDHSLARYLALEAGVGLAPGSVFGPGNTGFLRLCFARSQSELVEGMTRLSKGLERWS